MLTSKQQRFVEEYLVDLNATRAYQRAGYRAGDEAARRNGARMLTKADVSEAIAAGRARLSEQTGRTVAHVMADIERVRADAMQPITCPDTGAQTMLSHKDALKALELEGKHRGAFELNNRQKNPLGNFDGARLFAELFARPGAAE